MTMKIHRNYDISHGGSSEAIVFPFKIHLACFRIEPYKNVKELKLHLLPDGVSMALDFSVA